MLALGFQLRIQIFIIFFAIITLTSYNWRNIIFIYFIKKPSLSYYKHSSINTNDYAIENKFVSLNSIYWYVKLIFSH